MALTPAGGTGGVLVRPAREDELVAAGECVRAAYAAEGLADAAYQAVLADARGRAAAQGAEVLVAVDDGRLVGTVTFVLPGSPWSELARPGEAEFRMLGVSPAARGRGVAEALVRACLGRAAEAGARRVVLCSQPAMTAAHRLYARAGFVRAPELDWTAPAEVELLGFALDLPRP